MRGVDPFDTREHSTYTEEEPNSLPPALVPTFLAKMRELHAAHYAFTFLGFTHLGLIHYSTAHGGEMKQALAKVAKIATAGAKVIDSRRPGSDAARRVESRF